MAQMLTLVLVLKRIWKLSYFVSFFTRQCVILPLFILELLHLVSISVSMWLLSRHLNVFPLIFFFHSTDILFPYYIAGNMIYSGTQNKVPAFMEPTD